MGDGADREPAAAPRWGSDLVVDLLAAHGIRHVAFNPGASFRGLHDSLVNRPNAPELILCTHEKLAVNIAHGFAKAGGGLMACVLHDVVGLLHGTLGLYVAYRDRVPVLALGGAGPQDTERRRPWIDWLHTANIQGGAVREFTKWDDQPTSIAGLPAAIARAVRMATAEPAGPAYVALDAGLQEDPIEGPIPTLPLDRVGGGSRLGPDPVALDELARWLTEAERPMLVAGLAGRDPRAFTWIPELAELLGAGVVDTNDRPNIRTTHPLNVTGTELLGDADLVLLLDVKDPSRVLLAGQSATRTSSSRLAEGCRIVDLGFGDLQLDAWVQDVGPVIPMDRRITADTSVALPMLIELVRERLRREPVERVRIRAARRDSLEAAHRVRRARWQEIAEERSGASPVAPAWLAHEVYAAIREHDWVLTANTATEWAYRLWDIDAPHRHPGRSLGTATQVGISIGVALAHRGTGRLVVDIQPDGDLLFDAASLWIPAAHGIPMLMVMYDNRAYYNDWEHQVRMAEVRGTDPARAHIGVGIGEPHPDFAGLARSFGWHAEGPIDQPAAVRDAVARGARHVLDTGQPTLVHVVTAHR